MFRSALEIKQVTTSDLPIKKNPFIAFEIVDRTIIHNVHKKKYVVYVNPNSDENSAERWGTRPTTATSFTLRSTGSSIKHDALHDVVVCLFE